jgi:hypothetical protein
MNRSNLDCLGLGVLDRKRIETLKEFHAQKKSTGTTVVRQLMMPGMLNFPPILPDSALFQKSTLILLAYPRQWKSCHASNQSGIISSSYAWYIGIGNE